MSKNSYSGVDSYAAFFVAYKAKTLTRMPMFSADDFEDLQQELMIAYLHAWPSFDPSKGDRRSFIKASVNNAARNLVVAAEAQKRWTGITLTSLATAISDQDDSPTLADAIYASVNNLGLSYLCNIYKNPFQNKKITLFNLIAF